MPMGQQVESGRLAIIAGNGRLPLYVAEAARRQGEQPFIFALRDESSTDWKEFDHEPIGIGEIARFKRRADELGIDRIVMSGGVSRRPPLRDMRLGLSGFLEIPRMIRTIIGGGDNTVLTAVIELLENGRRKVISVQDIAPSLLSELGPIGRIAPDEASRKDLKVAVKAAKLIGTLDFGQGAIAVGGRVVALEGPEGTDAMLARVADLKQAGRVSAKRRGVLVKLCKAEQDVRVDLPSAGLATVKNAHAAGLAGVALEAGRSLLLDAGEVRAFADSHDMFVIGIDVEAVEGGR
jgi:UDP-2,3-diacylglucosamine hydrolase